jgi:hypothetical protein
MTRQGWFIEKGFIYFRFNPELKERKLISFSAIDLNAGAMRPGGAAAGGGMAVHPL